MEKKLILVGAGGLGRVVLEHVSCLYECVFLDDGEATVVDGVPVIGKTKEMDKFFPEYKLLLVTIGDNKLRQALFERAAAIGYTFPSVIHPSAYISSHAHVGSGCVILNNVVIQNNASCGAGCILNPGVELHHDSFVGDYCLIYTNSVVRSLTTVGNRAWIGSNVTVATSASVPDDGRVADGKVIKAC